VTCSGKKGRFCGSGAGRIGSEAIRVIVVSIVVALIFTVRVLRASRVMCDKVTNAEVGQDHHVVQHKWVEELPVAKGSAWRWRSKVSNCMYEWHAKDASKSALFEYVYKTIVKLTKERVGV
jgi:hypothetical protein